jgi:hypothetical protein
MWSSSALFVWSQITLLYVVHSLIVVFLFILSVSLCPKVITWCGFHCNYYLICLICQIYLFIHFCLTCLIFSIFVHLFHLFQFFIRKTFCFVVLLPHLFCLFLCLCFRWSICSFIHLYLSLFVHLFYLYVGSFVHRVICYDV